MSPVIPPPSRQLRRIAILGMGLIGSSLARALVKHAPDIHVAGFDLSHETLKYATQTGLIHSQHAHAGQAAASADIIVLAAPPSAFASLAADIAPFMEKGAILTDTGSVKRHAIAAVTRYMPEHSVFVPGHPIAGSAQSGPAAGDAMLFSGKRVILTPNEEDVLSEDVAMVRRMWEMTGARVEYMPADLHDRIYAYVSHLPQLVAFAARKQAQGLKESKDESYRRTTRLAHSNPALWAEICLANADYVAQALSDFCDFAAQMEGELSHATEEAGATDGNPAELFSQITATCLIATASLLQELTGVHPARYAGAGFADMTAPATAHPDAALKAISSHHRAIGGMLKALLTDLLVIQNAVERGDKKELMRLLGSE